MSESTDKADKRWSRQEEDERFEDMHKAFFAQVEDLEELKARVQARITTVGVTDRDAQEKLKGLMRRIEVAQEILDPSKHFG